MTSPASPSDASSAPSAALVRARRLTLRYGATRALDEARLRVEAGEVHALVGENGAGKSTLLRVVAGLARPQSGQLAVMGRARGPSGPVEAVRWGVGFAAQEIEICPELAVAEQVTLGREPRGRLGLIDRKGQRRRAAELLARVGSDVDPASEIHALGASQRKQVQIAAALSSDPRLLLLDEPTAALDARGTEGVARLLREHTRAGGSVLLVSHRIDEVLALADTVTVLRDGRHVSSDPARDLDPDTLVRRMVGRDIPPRRARRAKPDSGLALEWAGPVELAVRRGEILGLAGLVGAGRSETLEALAAAHPDSCALVPEERGRKGLVPTASLRENLFLPAPGHWLHPAAERRAAADWIETLAIRAPGPDVPILTLSGGNQQKVLLARALARHPRVVLLDEPTQGVDVGAKAEIHERVRDLADAGTGVVLASSDLPELLQLADRIVVLREGRAVGELDAARATEAEVVALASGVAA